eukprot:g33644.t1
MLNGLTRRGDKFAVLPQSPKIMHYSECILRISADISSLTLSKNTSTGKGYPFGLRRHMQPGSQRSLGEARSTYTDCHCRKYPNTARMVRQDVNQYNPESLKRYIFSTQRIFLTWTLYHRANLFRGRRGLYGQDILLSCLFPAISGHDHHYRVFVGYLCCLQIYPAGQTG